MTPPSPDFLWTPTQTQTTLKDSLLSNYAASLPAHSTSQKQNTINKIKQNKKKRREKQKRYVAKLDKYIETQ